MKSSSKHPIARPAASATPPAPAAPVPPARPSRAAMEALARDFVAPPTATSSSRRIAVAVGVFVALGAATAGYGIAKVAPATAPKPRPDARASIERDMTRLQQELAARRERARALTDNQIRHDHLGRVAAAGAADPASDHATN